VKVDACELCGASTGYAQIVFHRRTMTNSVTMTNCGHAFTGPANNTADGLPWWGPTHVAGPDVPGGRRQWP